MKCCICDGVITRDDAPVLTMGAVGTPKLLCDECAELLDTATLGREVEEIESAMDRLGKKMGESNPDRATFNIVSGLMAKAAGRGKAIKLGKYDCSMDEQDDESDDGEFDEIPEELLETEEDRALDQKDEENMEKFNKVYNVILAAAIIGFVGVLAWRLIERFLLN